MAGNAQQQRHDGLLIQSKSRVMTLKFMRFTPTGIPQLLFPVRMPLLSMRDKIVGAFTRGMVVHCPPVSALELLVLLKCCCLWFGGFTSMTYVREGIRAVVGQPCIDLEGWYADRTCCYF